MKHWLIRLGMNSILLGSLLICFADPVNAQGLDNLTVRIALHVRPHFYPIKGQTLCDGSPLANGPDDCSYYNTSFGAGFPGPHTYVIAVQGGAVGITGVSFGIDYDGATGVGVDPQYVQWTRCTDGLDFPNDGGNGKFPAPGGGIRVTWTSCQNSLSASGLYGVHALVGALYTYAYSHDHLRITPNNNLPEREFAVTDCALSTLNILDFIDPSLEWSLGGRVDFVCGTGFTPCHHGPLAGSVLTPCDVVPVHPTTWGQIKARYGN